MHALLSLRGEGRLTCRKGKGKGKGKGGCLESRIHVQQTLPFLWQGGRQWSLQLLIQPWICVPGTHYSWVDRGSVEYEVCLTLLHMASTGNRTPNLLILSPMPYPLGHMLQKEKVGRGGEGGEGGGEGGGELLARIYTAVNSQIYYAPTWSVSTHTHKKPFIPYHLHRIVLFLNYHRIK